MKAVFFEWLVERSWQAALLALLILSVQFALAGKLPARWRQAIWLPLLGLLVFPALPESRVSVFNYVNDDRLAWQAPVAVERESSPVSFTSEMEPLPLSRTPVVRRMSWNQVARIVWAVGAAGMLAMVVAANARFWRRLRRLPDVDDARLRGLLDDCRRELGMSRRVRMVRMPEREGPAVTGILRPVLLLPAEFSATFTDREIRLVLLHELGHWRRGDVLVNALLAVLRALHWFNPVLWWAFRRMRLDRELACDEWVLARTGECRAYGETLLKLSTDFEPSGAAAGVAGIFENREELKRRIRRIAGFSTNAGRWPLAGAALVLVLGATFLTRAVTQDVPLDPEVGKVVDRNGVLLAEYRREADGRLRAFHFPLGAFAAHLLYGLDEAALPQPGQVVYLTLDARVQAAAERALREVGRGAAVVLDPENGDILAMVSVPSFDPNRFFPSISAQEWAALRDDETAPLRNRATNACTPGATMLPFTMLAAAAANVELKDHVCTGEMRIGSLTFHCWKRDGHGEIGPEDALIESCNTYFYQLGIATGGENLQRMERNLGFGAVTGIPLKGDSPGIAAGPDQLKIASPREKWRDGYSANTAIGQGAMLATPLQVASAIAAVGNGGTVFRTRLVKKVVDAEGTKESPVSVRGMFREMNISDEALETVRKGLWGVVNASGGSGHKAAVDGLSVAGRTGTSQMWNISAKGEHMRDYSGWFSGYAPAERPQWAFSVVVQGAKSGGSTAAPVAAKLLEAIRDDGEFSPKRFEAAPGAMPESVPEVPAVASEASQKDTTSPMAEPVPDRPGMVKSPYVDQMVDVSGYPSGEVVIDPSTGKLFKVP